MFLTFDTFSKRLSDHRAHDLLGKPVQNERDAQPGDPAHKGLPRRELLRLRELLGCGGEMALLACLKPSQLLAYLTRPGELARMCSAVLSAACPLAGSCRACSLMCT